MSEFKVICGRLVLFNRFKLIQSLLLLLSRLDLPDQSLKQLLGLLIATGVIVHVVNPVFTHLGQDFFRVV